VIEEYEWADHLQRMARQYAAHLKAAEVARMRL
jgi:hypothetical protein